MKKSSFLHLILLALLAISCNPEDITGEFPFQPGDPPPPLGIAEFSCEVNEDLCALSTANNQFGFDIFRRLHESAPEENLFISPTSIGTALAMTANGAAGATQSDMINTMHLAEMNMEGANAAYETLLRVLPQLDAEVTAQLANSIWYREGVPVVPAFLETAQTDYDSDVRELDFSDPAAVDIINGWVSDHTNGLIENLLSDVPADALMYLINAIYFKGAWTQAFDPEATLPGPFKLPSGERTEVDMMRRSNEWLSYLETEDFQAVDLPYGKNQIFSMSLLLPKPESSLDEVIAQLEAGAWAEWSRSFAVDSIIFAMPKFEMRYKESLNTTLKELGMQRIFGAGADFSNLIEGGGVFVDEVLHEAFIRVDEEGTEAAAATSVTVVTSVPRIPIVVLDRPFLFLIQEKQTGSVLFLGKMMNPEG